MTSELRTPSGVDVSTILERNARRFGVPTEQLTGRRRFRSVTQARSTSQLEIREEKGLSFPEIGRLFHSHHSTVIHNVNRARQAREFNEWGTFEDDTAEARPTAGAVSETAEEYMQSYLDANFPGVTLKDVREGYFGVKLAKAITIPQQALIRYLFYDRGIHVTAISDQLNRDRSSIAYVLGKSEERIGEQVQAWKRQHEEQREVGILPGALSQEEITRAQRALLRQEATQELEDEGMSKLDMPAVIFTVISSTYGVAEEEIVSPTRQKEVAWTRHLIAYFLRLYTDLTFIQIGELANRVNHTTVLNSIKRVENSIEADEDVREEVILIKEDILDFARASSKTTNRPESSLV